MSDQLRTVRLYGSLGAKFGRVHRLAVSTIAEAVHALSMIVPGFEQELLAGDGRGVRYACFVGKHNLSEEEISAHSAGEGEFRIAPIIAGSKRGLFQVVLGAALVGLTLWNPAGVAGVNLIGGATVGGIAGSMGIALMMGGVNQMLTPMQKGLSTKDRPENGTSYNFNGVVNTLAQGRHVPVLYGRMIVGSATASAGIYAEDQA